MLIGAIGLFILSPLATYADAGAECSDAVRNTIGCPAVTATITPDDVQLSAEDILRNAPDRTDSDDDATATAPTDALADCVDPASTSCARPFIATVTAPVTLADIAAFRPDSARDHTEPNGWTIAGLDTNFYATGGSEIEDGMLLGQPAAVRFTAVAWHWSYGDGAAASHPEPGAPWSAQGAREFDPTATSHVYGQYGTYEIDLAVSYAAEYRYAGGPWVPISGRLNLPANRLVITVGNAKTVLVERECTANPGGPGC